MSQFLPTIHPWNEAIWHQLTSAQLRHNHALLINGHNGLGKVDLALALAHNVITTNHQQSIQLFETGAHPDLHAVLPEAEVIALEEGSYLSLFAQRYIEAHGGKPRKAITIDQIRQLNSALATHPHISQHRVVLIAYADKLNRNAANALLKSLEEPPRNTLFILVTNEISKLPNTIRSRCSLIGVRTPEFSTAKAWLEKQNSLPKHEIDNHLAMANNQPLLAKQLYLEGYIDVLKGMFNDVNGLWNQKRQPVETAKKWQDSGSALALETLQKLSSDLLKSRFSDNPKTVFFPVQQTWVQSSSHKLSLTRLLDAIDMLNASKRLLTTTVDELLVLESVAIKFKQLPKTAR